MLPNNKLGRMLVLALLVVALFLLAGCAQKMAVEGRYKPLQADPFFPDDRSARTLVSNTVPIAPYRPDAPFYTGQSNGAPVMTAPISMTNAMLLRGRERINIYCAPCHGGGLTGNGTVIQAGYPTAPSLLDPRFSTLPIGYLFDVVTHGFGTMPSYAVQIPPADRWELLSALQSIQKSQPAAPQATPTAKP